MPCACRDKNALGISARGISRSNPRPGPNGLYELRADPECSQPYQGMFRGATVFVVGYGTENETVYKRGERTQAINHAKEQNLTLDQMPASALCERLMVELLES